MAPKQVRTPEASDGRPGDETKPGTRQSAENICPRCAGTGRLNDEICRICNGTGRITAIVGDA
jgi:DnaJ-class molecular chaperone